MCYCFWMQIYHMATLRSSRGHYCELVAQQLPNEITSKTFPNESLDGTKVVYKHCSAELFSHRSTTSMKYHLYARQFFAVPNHEANGGSASGSAHQTTLVMWNKTAAAKLTNVTVRWKACSQYSQSYK